MDKKTNSEFLNSLAIILLSLSLLLMQGKVNNLKKDVSLKGQEIAELKVQIEDLTDLVNKAEWSDKVTDTIVCHGDTSFKSYMDYRCITDATSNQYQLIYSDRIIVGNDGLLYDEDGFIGVALGTAFGQVGDKFIVELDNGHIIKVIKVETKSDAHTIDGMYHKTDGSVVEFVIDIDKANKTYPLCITMGSFNYENKFNGNIKSISKVGW